MNDRVGRIRSLTANDLALGACKPWPPFDLRLPRPPALHLPVTGQSPAVVRVELLAGRPTVTSYRFMPPAAAVPPSGIRSPRAAVAMCALPPE